MTGFMVGEYVYIVQDRKIRKITTVFLIVFWVITLPEKQVLSLFYSLYYFFHFFAVISIKPRADFHSLSINKFINNLFHFYETVLS